MLQTCRSIGLENYILFFEGFHYTEKMLMSSLDVRLRRTNLEEEYIGWLQKSNSKKIFNVVGLFDIIGKNVQL